MAFSDSQIKSDGAVGVYRDFQERLGGQKDVCCRAGAPTESPKCRVSVGGMQIKLSLVPRQRSIVQPIHLGKHSPCRRQLNQGSDHEAPDE